MTEFARSLGISDRQFSRILADELEPSLADLVRMAATAGCELRLGLHPADVPVEEYLRRSGTEQ
jgi:transcriptional regulator with XRE-family HTH domain